MYVQLTKDYFVELRKCLDEISIKKLTQIAEIIYKAYERDNQIFIMGNGGSASTASHFACDINKSVSNRFNKRFKVVCLNDNIPIMLAYANDVSYEDIFVEQMKNFFSRDDLVIGISASGDSKNVLKAIQFANESGGKTIGLTGFDGGDLGKMVHLSLIIPVNDMQKVEDSHLIVAHILMKILYEKLKSQTDE